MMRSLRKAAKSWVAKGMMVSLSLAFGLWGINDIFRGGTPDTSVASVGDQKIPAADFDRELRNYIRNQSQRTHTDLTMEQARTSGVAQMVLDRLIERRALDNETASLRLTTSSKRVANEIRSMRQFQDVSGAFSRLQFEEGLRQNGFSEPLFEYETHRDIMRAQLLESVASAFTAPPALSRLLYNYINQTRTAEYLVLTPEMAGNVPAPTEAQLAEYHKANAQRFSTPEYREFEYVAIGPEQFNDTVQVSDADLKKEFELKQDIYVKPEEREIEQINFPSQEAADAAQKKIAAGTDFLALAHSMNLKDEDVKLGTFAKTGLAPELAAVAFAAPEGQVTPPVKGPFGWVMLRVTKVTPGSNKTFDELKDTLRQNIIKQRAAAQAADGANAFEDARAAGMSMADAAKKVGVEAVHVAAIDSNGLTPSGAKANVPAQAAFLKQLFTAEAGEEGDLFQTDDLHSYAIKIIGITPPAVKPLTAVRDQVVKEWSNTERAKMLIERTKALTKEAQKEGSLASAAKALGRQPVTSTALKRDAKSDVFSPEILGEMFGVPPGGVVAGPLGKGEGFAIVRVLNVQTPDPNADQSQYQEIKQLLGQQIAADLVQSMAASARETQGATFNSQAFDRVFGGNNDE